jgi:hypothetical protein
MTFHLCMRYVVARQHDALNHGRMTMTLYKYAAIGVTVACMALTGVIMTNARAERTASGDQYKAAQGIIETFGSKHAVGYFAQQDGACAMTLFLAEANDEGNRVPTAARVRINVKAGDKAELGSVEGQSVEIVCGSDASTVEVRHGTFKAAYVTQ